MNQRIIKSYIRITFWLSFFISLLIHFTGIVESYQNYVSNEIDITFLIGNSFSELFITAFILIVLFTVNYYTLKPYKIRDKTKVTLLLFSFIISFAIVFIISHLLFLLKDAVFLEEKGYGNKYYAFKDLIITIVVIISIQIIKVLNQNQTHVEEIQNLKIENLQRQFDTLKNQLSPHFLFNSLNSLKTLVRENQELAQQYINNLSNILRYTLQANENKIVSLAEEIKFITSYFFLVKIRYAQNISLEFSGIETFNNYKIPSLSLQILIENAVKHNEISKHKPLSIKIKPASDCSIIIENNINPKFSNSEGTGLGLANLASQYKLLNLPEILISKNEDLFSVEIHLLKP